jgi:hypothetical protein
MGVVATGRSLPTVAVCLLALTSAVGCDVGATGQSRDVRDSGPTSESRPPAPTSQARLVAAFSRYVRRAPAVLADVEVHGPIVRVVCKPPEPTRYHGAPVSLCFVHYEDGLAPLWCAALAGEVLYTNDRHRDLPCPRAGVPALPD